MQTAASNSLILTDSSSFKRIASSQAATSYGGFYQQLAAGLVKGGHKHKFFCEVGERLAAIAEHAYAFRRMDAVAQVSQALARLPSQQYEDVGRYYQALCIQGFGRGDVSLAEGLLERVLETAPPAYRLRAIISLGANSHYQSDNQAALSRYREAARFASRDKIYDAYATLGTQKMFAVINSEEGDHRGALNLLENLFPLAHAMRLTQPHVYYDYMNSLAVELCEAGRLREAENVSRIVIASPFAGAYPEWRETREEIELRGSRASRSVVAMRKAITETPLRRGTANTPVSLAPIEEGNLVRLPLANPSDRRAPVETFQASQPARVLSMQKWKKRMARQNGDRDKWRRPTPSREERAARLYEMENLGTRGMLLRAMEMLGDERVTDDQLRRALIILEGLELDENAGP